MTGVKFQRTGFLYLPVKAKKLTDETFSTLPEDVMEFYLDTADVAVVKRLAAVLPVKG